VVFGTDNRPEIWVSLLIECRKRKREQKFFVAVIASEERARQSHCKLMEIASGYAFAMTVAVGAR
jgi:hypothetical protein